MHNSTCIITGNGQDTAYLSELLLQQGYKVVIMTRRSGSSDNWRLRELGIDTKVTFEWCDLIEYHSVCDIIKKYKPLYLFQLAAQSFVHSSFNQPFTTTQVNYIGHLNVLEAVRQFSWETKVYFAASSEMFGKVLEVPQSETTPFYPRSPYGISKLASYWLTINYRESYQMFASNGILFNHESPTRGSEFVTRKITKKVAEIVFGSTEPLIIGDVSIRRDWGHARDYVRGMLMMLHHFSPDNFVLATGTMHTIKQFIDKAFECVDIKLTWNETNTLAIDSKGRELVKSSSEFTRPAEVNELCGDYTKAKTILGWKPTILFEQLVEEMVEADIKRLSKANGDIY